MALYLLRDDIFEIATLIENGGTILYPTDTIWGIGCDATNETAIARISELKNRPPEKGYVILVNSIEMLKQYVTKIHPRVETLLAFHHQPLTVIYKDVVGLPSAALAPDGSAAIRVAQDEFCKKLIGLVKKPLISTSANVAGEKFPAHFGEVTSDIISGVDYVVKHRQDDKTPHEPSVIAKYDRTGELDFIRE